MRTERVTFAGHDGSPLAARLDLPDSGARALALFAHCFTCGKDIAAARRVAARLTEADIGVLRFDFTGLGQSDGAFADTTFSSNAADLLAAANWLRETHAAPQIIIGHSLGGAAVLAAAGALKEIRAVAVVAAPHDPAHVLHLLGDGLDVVRREGTAEIDLAGRPFTFKKTFVDDVEAVDLDGMIAGLKKALLVLHAPRDDTVGVENASRIFAAAKHPKSFVSLDGADHLLSRDADAQYAADVIAVWAGRYVTLAPVGAEVAKRD